MLPCLIQWLNYSSQTQGKKDTNLNADDLVLLSESSSGLQSCLNKLEAYTEKWGLKLNLKKTKMMMFNNSRAKKPKETF